ncbi:MAG: urease accessory protein UreF [Leptolyngbyaceae cyanobacterium bins.302]|nr:urease accessory protein UreF [Leptolyngbyaceae cyanobacterium bins.302]
MSQLNQPSLLRLLQLASPALPVGAYSYSEALETLVDGGIICNQAALEHWIIRELNYGAVQLEAGILLRSQRAIAAQDWQALESWNLWLSAVRDTEELRLQSWQMGRSLLKLLRDLHPELSEIPAIIGLWEDNCNFAVAFAIAAFHWQIDEKPALLGYLHSWVTNLVNAGIKLIPLGQTAGQHTLIALQPHLEDTAEKILPRSDTDLENCGWGLAIASMTHETQYSRLFRS